MRDSDCLERPLKEGDLLMVGANMKGYTDKAHIHYEPVDQVPEIQKGVLVRVTAVHGDMRLQLN